jgi:hypothetical protein
MKYLAFSTNIQIGKLKCTHAISKIGNEDSDPVSAKAAFCRIPDDG